MRIAVCDDDMATREYIVALIKEQMKNMAVVTFASEEEMLKAKEDFDISFLDVKMKELSGMDVAKHIRQEQEQNGSKKSIIIFVTGYEKYMNDLAEMLADIAVILLLQMLLYKKDLSHQLFVTVSFLAGKEIIKYVVSVSATIWCNIILFFADPNTMKTSEQAARLEFGLFIFRNAARRHPNAQHGEGRKDPASKEYRRADGIHPFQRKAK